MIYSLPDHHLLSCKGPTYLRVLPKNDKWEHYFTQLIWRANNASQDSSFMLAKHYKLQPLTPMVYFAKLTCYIVCNIYKCRKKCTIQLSDTTAIFEQSYIWATMFTKLFFKKSLQFCVCKGILTSFAGIRWKIYKN